MSKNVLITGANSGLGFDAARQLAEAGWDRIVISARSKAKADEAIRRLVQRTGKTPETFGSVLFDNNDPTSVRRGVADLAARKERFDAVVLNAGGMGHLDDEGKPQRLPDGTGELFAMNVGGHAVLVEDLVASGLLTDGATVMFAGSEVSRGIPVMKMAVPSLPKGFGDEASTVQAIVRGEHMDLDGYDPMLDYGMIKLIGTEWIKHLHTRHGLRAISVSPGFTGGTAGMDKLPAVQRMIFRFVALPILKLLGNAHGLETGAQRYVQALEDADLAAGQFYASPPGRISGPLTPQGSDQQPLLADAAFAAAAVQVVDQYVAQHTAN